MDSKIKDMAILLTEKDNPTEIETTKMAPIAYSIQKGIGAFLSDLDNPKKERRNVHAWLEDLQKLSEENGECEKYE